MHHLAAQTHKCQAHQLLDSGGQLSLIGKQCVNCDVTWTLQQEIPKALYHASAHSSGNKADDVRLAVGGPWPDDGRLR